MQTASTPSTRGKSVPLAAPRVRIATSRIACWFHDHVNKDRHMRNKLFVVALLLTIAAGPAYSQNKEILQLQADMITVQQQVRQLQSSIDANNGTMKGMVEKIADQVNTVAGGMQKLNESVA